MLARLATHVGEAAIADAEEGRLPLHWAANYRCRAPFEVMQVLLDARPAAASTPDVLGALPLHSAAINGEHADVVELLLRAYPEAALHGIRG